MDKTKKGLYIYWTLNQRIVHIVLFLAVICAILTGIPLKYYEYSFAVNLMNLFGSYFILKLIHNVMGIIIVIALLIHIGTIIYVWIRTENFFKTLQMWFSADDLKSVKDIFLYLCFIKGKPESGQYTLFGKIDYFTTLISILLLSFSGLILMFPVASTAFFSLSWLPVAHHLHSSLSIFFIVYIMIGHLFNAHIHPEKLYFNSVWLTGTLTEEKMRQYHALELSNIERKEGDLKAEFEKKAEEVSREKKVKQEQKMLEDYLNEGNAFVKSGNYEEAINRYKEAIKIYPNFSQARFNIGVAFKKNEQYEEAIGAFREFVSMDPFNEMAERSKSIIRELTDQLKDKKDTDKDEDGKDN